MAAQRVNMLRVFIVVVLFTLGEAASAGCKNCRLSKAQLAMLQRHSAACLPQSGAEPHRAEALLRGAQLDGPEMRRFAYCVLRACKLVGKDGKLLKIAGADTNATKVIEACASAAGGETPEECAWSVFRCGLHSKLLQYLVPVEAETKENH